MKSPVLKYCPPGSERGALGNQRPYLDTVKFRFMIFKSFGSVRRNFQSVF